MYQSAALSNNRNNRERPIIGDGFLLPTAFTASNNRWRFLLLTAFTAVVNTNPAEVNLLNQEGFVPSLKEVQAT